MSEQDAMTLLRTFGDWGLIRLNALIRWRRFGMAREAKVELGELEAFNLCAGRLAEGMGLASLAWKLSLKTEEAA